MNLKDNIKISELPKHVAVIMDGNGRWALKQGKSRVFGHQNGVNAVRETVTAAAELGIKFLTLYAFSTENWNRPKEEVDALMNLLIESLSNELETLLKNNINLKTIGITDKLNNECQSKLNEIIDKTSSNSGLTLILALNYSGQSEILNAVKNIAKAIESGTIKVEQIDEVTIKRNLFIPELPDPELLIRTSGEQRISNFLLWQLAYTELYFTPVLWPDFDKNNFYQAIIDYQKRERRFGKISEQISY